MPSPFSFARRPPPAPGELPAALPTARTESLTAPGTAASGAASIPAEVPAAPVRELKMNSSPVLNQAQAAMLGRLQNYLPPPVSSSPAPTVSLVSVTERAVGLGQRRGIETRGFFPVVDLKGVRLDALVRFQLWATDSAQIETAMTDLNARLLADRDALWSAGFLRLALDAAPPFDLVPSINAWRKQADYRILYEYRYQDSDEAESLIAQIPIGIDSEFGESTIVTDEMARWDNQRAPVLVVRGAFNVGGISALTFIPGAMPGGRIILTRTFDAAVGGPILHPSLPSFLTAVAGPNPPERNAQVAFASLTDFLAVFTVAGDPITMGDWDADNVPDVYNSRILPFTPSIVLPDVIDRFEIGYQNAPFDKVAVVYLRATRGPKT